MQNEQIPTQVSYLNWQSSSNKISMSIFEESEHFLVLFRGATKILIISDPFQEFGVQNPKYYRRYYTSFAQYCCTQKIVQVVKYLRFRFGFRTVETALHLAFLPTLF